MTEHAITPDIAITFKRDKTDIYLLPSQIWYGRLFSHYTLSSISNNPAGETQHSFAVADLASHSLAAERLADQGWQIGSYVGKLMLSSEAELAAFQRFAEQNVDDRNRRKCPNLPQSALLAIVKKHIGFTSSLFLTQPDVSSAQLVAGTINSNQRIARRVPDEREESYYGHFQADAIRLSADDASLADSWKDIEALHRLFYDQTVQAITSGALSS